MYMDLLPNVVRCVYLSSTSFSRPETPHLHRVAKHDCIKHKKKRKEKGLRRRKAGEGDRSEWARPARCREWTQLNELPIEKLEKWAKEKDDKGRTRQPRLDTHHSRLPVTAPRNVSHTSTTESDSVGRRSISSMRRRRSRSAELLRRRWPRRPPPPPLLRREADE